MSSRSINGGWLAFLCVFFGALVKLDGAPAPSDSILGLFLGIEVILIKCLGSFWNLFRGFCNDMEVLLELGRKTICRGRSFSRKIIDMRSVCVINALRTYGSANVHRKWSLLWFRGRGDGQCCLACW